MIVDGRNLAMTRGDSEAVTVTMYLQGNGEQRQFANGDTVYFTVKANPSSEKKLLQKIVTEFDNGAARIEIEPHDTKALDFGSYYYDIQYTNADGGVKTLVPPGRFDLMGEITYE